MPQSPLKIAITGASGFLGRATCARLLEDGHALVPVSRRGAAVAGVDGVAADVTDRASLGVAFEGCDVVVRAARRVSHHAADAREMWYVHVVGTENVLTHAMNLAANASGSSSENTRPMVSCDGMPFGRSSTSPSQSSFALPKSSICTKPSAPQMTARMLRMTMSRSAWSRVRSIRGSGRPSKASRRVGM